MQVEKILNNDIITPKTSGYTAVAGLGTSFITGMVHNKTLKKAHKPIVILTALASILHIAQIEYLHHKYKNKS